MLPPLQFLLLSLLFAGPQTGQFLRRALNAAGHKTTPASFTRLIQRLQFGGCVEPVIHTTPDGQRTESPLAYEVTDLGVVLWLATRDFYASRPAPPPDLKPPCSDMLDLAAFSPKKRRQIADRRFTRQLKRRFYTYARDRLQQDRHDREE